MSDSIMDLITDLIVDEDVFNMLDEDKQRKRLAATDNDDIEQQKLFNNDIDNEQAFGISRTLVDNLSRLQQAITPKEVQEDYKYNGKTFTVKSEKNKKALALRIIDDKKEIQTAEQFYKRLARIKDAKVMQTFLALWNYANQQGSFIFSGTRLSKVMQTVLKLPKDGYFTQPQKKEFTEAIHYFRDCEIWLDQTITDTNEKGRKQQVIERSFYKMIDLEKATYAKRKKDLINPETGKVIFKKGTADNNVILKLYGELLPRFNKGIMRGRLYSKGLLELDANKDKRAIFLGFKLLTRFDQLRMGRKGQDNISDDNLCIKTDRKTLIEWAGYEQTDEMHKGVANKQLIKTLDKLKTANILRDYKPQTLTTNDDLKITLYPSRIALEPQANGGEMMPVLSPSDKMGG